MQDGAETYYVFNSLPFGISTAGHNFTKTIRVLIKYWRSLGHRIVMVLDDGIGGHRDYINALELSQFVKTTLLKFGFLLAEKCNWLPANVSC